jgi:hypothetical protein
MLSCFAKQVNNSHTSTIKASILLKIGVPSQDRTPLKRAVRRFFCIYGIVCSASWHDGPVFWGRLARSLLKRI